jgi:hypothetical protein
MLSDEGTHSLAPSVYTVLSTPWFIQSHLVDVAVVGTVRSLFARARDGHHCCVYVFPLSIWNFGLNTHPPLTVDRFWHVTPVRYAYDVIYSARAQRRFTCLMKFEKNWHVNNKTCSFSETSAHHKRAHGIIMVGTWLICEPSLPHQSIQNNRIVFDHFETSVNGKYMCMNIGKI